MPCVTTMVFFCSRGNFFHAMTATLLNLTEITRWFCINRVARRARATTVMLALPSRWTHRAEICYVVYYCVANVITVCEHVNPKQSTTLIDARCTRRDDEGICAPLFFFQSTISHSYVASEISAKRLLIP